MSVITIEEAREHLEVIGTDQDAKIMSYLAAAEAHAEQFLGRPLVPWSEEESSESSSTGNGPPADVIQAIKLFLGDYYNLREAGITGTIFTANPAAENLLHFHRRGLGI